MISHNTKAKAYVISKMPHGHQDLKAWLLRQALTMMYVFGTSFGAFVSIWVMNEYFVSKTENVARMCQVL